MAAVDWDARYAAKKYCYGKLPNACVVEAVEKAWLPKGRVLLLGEGEGRNAVYLAAQGYACVATDPAPAALTKCAKLTKARGVHVETMQADAIEALGTGPYDCIVSVFCAYRTACQRKEAHAKVMGTLWPGGRFLYVGFGADHGNVERAVPGPGPDRLAAPDTIVAELGEFDVVEATERERDLFEGPFHRGHASVTCVVLELPQRRSFGAAIDACAAPPVIEFETGDALLDTAAPLARHTMRHAAGRCQLCWSAPCACTALFGEAMASCAPRLVLVAHPSELFRTTASAPLVPVLIRRAAFAVWGVHTATIDAALASGAAILFPDEAADAIDAETWRGTIIVPDGSWARAQAVVAALDRRAAHLGLERVRRLALAEASLTSMHSPLVDALHAGSGRGRCSTAEAVALACREGGDDEAAAVLTDAVERLAAKVAAALPRPPSPRTRAYDETSWVAALSLPSTTAPAVQGVRRCVVCGAGLARADALQAHVRGRRHRAAVARTAFDAGAITGEPMPVAAAAIFEAFSTAALARAPAEPPDAALAEVHPPPPPAPE